MGRRVLAAAAGIVCAVVLFLAGGHLMLAALERQLIYFPSPAARGLPAPRIPGADEVEEVWIETEDGVTIHGLHARRANPSAELLYFHGNAGNLYDRLDHVAALLAHEFGVLIVDYRGYGKSEGRPDEPGLYRDATAAYLYLTETRGVEPGRVVAYGHSLGSAVAIELATRVPLGALIAESPFTTARDMARLHYGWIPEPLLGFMTHDFDSLGKVPRLRAPVLYVHGLADEIVPAAMGRSLFDASPEPKEWFEIGGAAHNDLWSVGGYSYYRMLADFIERHVRGGRG